jgi:hypothetical protein
LPAPRFELHPGGHVENDAINDDKQGGTFGEGLRNSAHALPKPVEKKKFTTAW